MTWMMNNQRPIAVTALVQTIKPQIYGRVDDQATVLIQFPGAQGIIQASWNWPYDRKDFEVYAQHGQAVAIKGNELRVRLGKEPKEESRTLEPLPPDAQDSVSYLASVVRGKFKPSGLSSLENNMIVTEILTSARDRRTGKTIQLQ